MKIVILDKKTVTEGDISLKAIEDLGEVISYDITEKEDIVKNIGDAEIALCNKVSFDADVIDQCKNLKYIGIFATGYNNINLEAARDKGIIVCNAPSYSTDAVAQHTFAFILHFMNKVAQYNQSVNEDRWINSKTFSYFPYPISEVAGKILGIAGYGSIGQKVAEIARAFGMKIIVYTRTKKDVPGIEFVNEEDLFKNSDILTIHCPLTEETRNFVNKERIELMKRDAILINTARGPIINEQDLADALNNERIAGAGLDVLSREPMREDNPLKSAKNCVITPHIGWAPIQARERLIGIVADNIKHFIDGNPMNVVN